MDQTPPPEGPPKGAGEPPRPVRRRPREFTPREARATDPVLRNLKLAFAEVEAEPLPDDLAALMAQIEEMQDLGGKRNDDR